MICLDNSATTPVCPEAAAAALDAMTAGWHNPSAPYRPALDAQKRMQAARQALCSRLGAAKCVYTAGGTEADNLAVLGAAQRFRAGKAHTVLLSAAEHAAVMNQRPALEAMGHTVRIAPLTPEGVLDLDAFAGMLDASVSLVSVMHVSNETGAIQPLAEAARLLRAKAPDALLHSDGVQAFLRVPADMAALGVDLYAISGHKLHAPKGIGALLLSGRAKAAPRLYGGGQEDGLRGGTENTPGIAALRAAADAFPPDAPEAMRRLKRTLYEALRDAVPGLAVNGPAPDSDRAAPHILNVSFPGVRGETLLHACEAKGLLIGTGAACASRRHKESEAFRSMGIGKARAETAVRLSLSYTNTEKEMDEAAGILRDAYRALRVFKHG